MFAKVNSFWGYSGFYSSYKDFFFFEHRIVQILQYIHDNNEVYNDSNETYEDVLKFIYDSNTTVKSKYSFEEWYAKIIHQSVNKILKKYFFKIETKAKKPAKKSCGEKITFPIVEGRKLKGKSRYKIDIKLSNDKVVSVYDVK